MRQDRQNSSHKLAEQQASNRLIYLIRKLRWMGLEQEARRAEDQLTLRPVAAADTVVAMPHETD
jgi:hypothetical protein